MTDQKIKTASRKPPLALIPFIWLYGLARVLAYGAKAYAKGNHYTATLDDGAGERYVGAAMRHLGLLQEPDGTWSRTSLAARDNESGLPHIDHALCSLGILRGILVKDGVLSADPGEGKEPPNVVHAVTDLGQVDVLCAIDTLTNPLAWVRFDDPLYAKAAERLVEKGALERRTASDGDSYRRRRTECPDGTLARDCLDLNCWKHK